MEQTRRITDLVRTLDTEIPDTMARLDIPGLAIGICDDTAILWSAGFGSTDRSSVIPITATTRFSVQSMSKLFTATLVMQAVQSGLVDLDVPVSAYLPRFSVHSLFDDHPERLITLRHLLGHTAGFTHEAPIGSNFDLGTGDFEEHCLSISDTWLRFPVGHHCEYSNLGIDLAGYILQVVTGTDFAEHAKRVLFDPLGLGHSTFDARVFGGDVQRAIGHWRPFTRAGLPLPVAVPMVAAGGLYTCLEDALRFVQFQLREGEGVLASNLLAEQRTVPFALPGQSLGYGLGVYVDEWEPEVRVFHHGGSGFGYQAQLWWLPEQSIGAAVLTNSFDHSLHNDLAARITSALANAGSVRGQSEVRATSPSVVSPESDDVDALVGEYVGRLDDRELIVEDGRLFMRSQTTFPARLVDHATIEVEGPLREHFLFSDGPYGRSAYLHSVRDGRVWYRNGPSLSAESTLDQAHVGTYVARAWGLPVAWYQLRQDGSAAVIERTDLAERDAPPRLPLRLRQVGPDLYLSSNGEMLDLTSSTPRYASVELTKVEDG